MGFTTASQKIAMDRDDDCRCREQFSVFVCWPCLDNRSQNNLIDLKHWYYEDLSFNSETGHGRNMCTY